MSRNGMFTSGDLDLLKAHYGAVRVYVAKATQEVVIESRSKKRKRPEIDVLSFEEAYDLLGRINGPPPQEGDQPAVEALSLLLAAVGVVVEKAGTEVARGVQRVLQDAALVAEVEAEKKLDQARGTILDVIEEMADRQQGPTDIRDIRVLKWSSRVPLNALRNAGVETVEALVELLEADPTLASLETIGDAWNREVVRALFGKYGMTPTVEKAVHAITTREAEATQANANNGDDPETGDLHATPGHGQQHPRGVPSNGGDMCWVRVIRFQVNGERYSRRVERAGNGEFDQLRADIKARWPTMALNIYRTMKPDWAKVPISSL